MSDFELSLEMEQFLDNFSKDTAQPVGCVFEDGPAIIVRDMNMGCIALKNTVVQALCPQHDSRRTPMEGDVAVVDLSVGAAWSEHQGIEPLYMVDQNGGLTDFTRRPIVGGQQ